MPMTIDQKIELILLYCDVMYADKYEGYFCTLNYHRLDGYSFGHVAIVKDDHHMTYDAKCIDGSIWEGNTLNDMLDNMIVWVTIQWTKWKNNSTLSA
jgi:hypothetical protein